MTRKQLEPLLSKYKVIVPRKRNYYISTVYEQYASTMNGGKEELDLTRMIVSELTPQYLKAFDTYMHCRGGITAGGFLRFSWNYTTESTRRE